MMKKRSVSRTVKPSNFAPEKEVLFFRQRPKNTGKKADALFSRRIAGGKDIRYSLSKKPALRTTHKKRARPEWTGARKRKGEHHGEEGPPDASH